MEVNVRRARLEMLKEMNECLKFEHMKLEARVFDTTQRLISAQGTYV